MGKIVYNKNKSGKQMGGRGPRDIQREQELVRQQKFMKESLTKEKVDMSQYLPLTEVRKKIEEAVKFEKDRQNKELEKTKYELIKSVRKYNKLQNEIIELKDELKEKDLKIVSIETELRITKESGAGSEILQQKLDRLYDKIADGSISPLVGTKMGRPDLEDKLFIDPIDADAEKKLDAHIKVEEEKSKDRNVDDDLDKLRSLLKYKKK